MSWVSSTSRAAALSLLLLSTVACGADVSNKWRIQCSGGAESDGVIQFRVTANDGAPYVVSVNIEDGRSENGVARDIRDAFAKQLPKGRYSVETDDGEDVLVKKSFGESNFSIEVVSNTVEDVRINLDQE